MHTARTLGLVVAMLFSLGASELACYYPDGKNATGLSPCKTDADVSHCCRDSDVCLTNGLCFSSGLGSVVRRGCTDKTWKSPDCPNVCNIETFRSGDAVLTPCGTYNNFCCGQDASARSCCDINGSATLAAQIPGGDVMGIETATSSPTLASIASSTPTGTGTLTPSGAACPSSRNTERSALIGVAAAFGAIMIIAAALAIFWLIGMKKQEKAKLKAEKDRDDVEMERQKLEKSKQQLEHDKQELEQGKHLLEQDKQRLERAMPSGMLREMESARRSGRHGA
ncbi:Nn.00g039890.m01.CDS01 [Neocucurbitaria sp. VM-36]